MSAFLTGVAGASAGALAGALGGYVIGHRKKIRGHEAHGAGVRRGKKLAQKEAAPTIARLEGQVIQYQLADKARSDAKDVAAAAARYGSSRIEDGFWTGCKELRQFGPNVYGLALDEDSGFKVRPFLSTLGWGVYGGRDLSGGNPAIQNFAGQVRLAGFVPVFIYKIEGREVVALC